MSRGKGGRRGHRPDCPHGTNTEAPCICRGRKAIFEKKMWAHIGGYLPEAVFVEMRKRTAALGITASTYFRGLIEADLKKHALASGEQSAVYFARELSEAAHRKAALTAYKLDTQRGAAMTKGGNR
jgi:hypothetical protein